MLTREDKIWLSQLAYLLLRGISEVIVGDYKTMISARRAKDILDFGETGKSSYTDFKETKHVETNIKARRSTS